MKNAYLFACIFTSLSFFYQLWCHKDTEALVISDTVNIACKILKLRPKTDQKIVTGLTQAIIKYGRQYQIDPDELIAIAFVESKFDPKAKSKTGDYGVMQVNFKTWKKFLEKKEDLYNIDKCVEMACKIIKRNRDSGYVDLACYHSRTPHHKLVYAARLEKCLAEI
jgi:soluble lytic murein transglycosylase-like protein